MKLRCLSITQPYASLIVDGPKAIENRDWKSLPSYRGWVAIHTGLKAPPLRKEDISDYDEFLHKPFAKLAHIDVRGAIIGLAYLENICWKNDLPSDIKKSQRDWIFGQACLYFPKRFPLGKSISFKGQLGLFKLPSELESPLLKEVERFESNN